MALSLRRERARWWRELSGGKELVDGTQVVVSRLVGWWKNVSDIFVVEAGYFLFRQCGCLSWVVVVGVAVCSAT